MKIKWNAPQAMCLPVAEYRDGNAILETGDSFEVTDALGRELLESSTSFSEVGAKKSAKDE